MNNDALQARVKEALGRPQGLAASVLPRRALHQATDTVKDLYETARTTGDEGARLALDLTRVAMQATSSSPEVALKVYDTSLHALEKGAVASAGYLAELGCDLRGAIRDASKPGLFHSEKRLNEMHDTATRQMLDSLRDSAQVLHAPQAEYLTYLSELGAVYSKPGNLMNMAQRANFVPDVSSPAWFAVIASGIAFDDQFERKDPHPMLLKSVPPIRRLAEQQKDVNALDHLNRLDRYLAVPDLPEDVQVALHLGMLNVLQEKVAAGPEAALVFLRGALKGQNLPPRAEQTLLDMACAEARTRTYPPDSPLPLWLDFRDAVASIDMNDHDFWRLQRATLHAMTEGKPLSAASVLSDVDYYVSLLPPDASGVAAAGTLFTALQRLEPGGDPKQMAALGRKLADSSKVPSIQHHLLEMTLDAVRSLNHNPQADTLDAVIRHELAGQTSIEGQIKVLQNGLDQTLKLGQDALQGALISATAPPPTSAPATVEKADDYVTIGTLRIPRRLVESKSSDPSHPD